MWYWWGVLGFVLGYVVASVQHPDDYLSEQSEKQQRSELAESSTPNQDQAHQSDQIPQTWTSTQQLRNHGIEIQHLIEQSTTDQVKNYLEKIYPRADLSGIQDQKKFAQRLLEEFSQSENEQEADLSGQVMVTTQQQNPTPQHHHTLNQLYPHQQLFAHLRLLQPLREQQLVIRWIYRDTGEVLMLMPQNVSTGQIEHWVSFNPPQGWKVGDYDVRYYDMTDQLQPIAQSSFRIESVIEPQ